MILLKLREKYLLHKNVGGKHKSASSNATDKHSKRKEEGNGVRRHAYLGAALTTEALPLARGDG